MNINLKPKKKVIYPSKTKLNLAMKEKSPLRPSRLIPALLVLALALSLFCKVAVLDRLEALDLAEGQLTTLDAQRTALKEATASYPEIAEAYAHLASDWMTEDMKQAVTCDDALTLVEQVLEPVSKITHISLNKDLLVAETEKLDLADTSALVAQLYGLPNVTNVLVQQGSSEQPKQKEAKIYFLITMTNQIPEEEETPAPEAADSPAGEEGGDADALQ